MPGVEERLDKVEGRLGSVEGRLGSVEGRLGSVEGRLGSVEERLGSVESGVNGLRGEVQKLRVLGEEKASEFRLVAEGQGARLDEITKALEPLARIDNFVRLVADDHEVRIKRLEQRAGI